MKDAAAAYGPLIEAFDQLFEVIAAMADIRQRYSIAPGRVDEAIETMIRMEQSLPS